MSISIFAASSSYLSFTLGQVNCLIRQSLLSWGDKGLNAALKDAALKEYPALALKAFDSDISPEPDYLPLIAAAGVLLLEANRIAQLYLQDHPFYLKWAG
jgi:hypothetical protein